MYPLVPGIPPRVTNHPLRTAVEGKPLTLGSKVDREQVTPSLAYIIAQRPNWSFFRPTSSTEVLITSSLL
jgi:hypothetical protein